MTYTPTTEEKEFLANYDGAKYSAVSYTADLNIMTILNGELSVLLVRRGGFPYKGCWALPGGFVNPDESSEDAAVRELREETGIDIASIHLEQLKTYSEPDRDPRMRVISTAYLALVPNVGIPTAGDDADEARFFSVKDILNPEEEEDRIVLAFDHEVILKDALQRSRDKLEWSPLATTFLEQPFTIADLRRVYETVWGVRLHAANFRRKVLSVEDYLLPLGLKGESQFVSGRSAELYNVGNATMLFPPLIRPTKDETNNANSNE